MSEDSKLNILSSLKKVSGWTGVSRVFGLIRDMATTNLLGASVFHDIFVVTLKIPNLFRRFFAEGAFNTAFIPILSKKIDAKDDPQVFASDALSILIAMLLILTAIAEIIMPLLVFGTASGFSSDSRFDLSVGFGRVMFPYICLISLSAFLGGILNSAEGLSAFFNPTINSYRRINAPPTKSGASWSPSSISYTGNNRTHMLSLIHI